MKIRYVDNPPNLEEWARFYELMAEVKDLAPWEWLFESHVFGIEHPETGEQGFVSVMGNAGEHLAIALYQGVDALNGFLYMQEQGPSLHSSQVAPLLLTIPEIQASFEDRAQLDQTDRSIQRALKVKLKGRRVWPQCRVFRPAHFPWHPEAEELYFMNIALEQVLEVAPRFKDDPDSMMPKHPDKYLIRKATPGSDPVEWKDHIVKVKFSDPPPVDVKKDWDTVTLKALPKGGSLEMDVFMMTSPVKTKDARAYFPFTMLLVDTHGNIVGTEIIPPLPTLDDMWGDIANHLASAFEKMGRLPIWINVRTSDIEETIRPLVDDLGINLRVMERLHHLDPARQSLEQWMRGTP